MRVLLDEMIPRILGRVITGHEVRSVRHMRWTGTRNGALLRRATAAGFEALVTMDRSIEYQQNLAQFGLRIVILRALSNRIDDLFPLASRIIAALDSVSADQVVYVGDPPTRSAEGDGEGVDAQRAR
jgi:hypothetical protein